MVARIQNAPQDVSQLRLITDKPQQRFPARAVYANAEDVFGGRVQVENEQAIVENDDTGTE